MEWIGWSAAVVTVILAVVAMVKLWVKPPKELAELDREGRGRGSTEPEVGQAD